MAIFSYDGGLTFGVTGDYDEASDIDVLCRGIEQSLRELAAAADSERPTQPPGRRARSRSTGGRSGGSAPNGVLPHAARGGARHAS